MIKIKFSDFCGNEIPSFFMKILETAEIDYEISDNPDFLFYSTFGYDYLKYDCIKIFWTGENVRPDFNLCDYAIGFDYMTFEDRYFRSPLYYLYSEDVKKAQGKHLMSAHDIYERPGFCNFVYSNNSLCSERNMFFDLLSKYKKVDAGGKLYNNVGGPVSDKFAFQSNYKFSIAFENSSSSGYSTEKILQAFSAGTIPIYWGDPRIGEQFNTKSFINCFDYSSFDEVIELIKKIDNDEKLFSEYISAPAFLDATSPEMHLKQLQEFILHIVKQDVCVARRRSQGYWASKKEKELKRYSTLFNPLAKMKGILNRIR